MVDAEILAYYEHGLEQDRLTSGERQIEFLRVWDLLERHLPPAPAQVPDVGGGGSPRSVDTGCHAASSTLAVVCCS